MAMGLTTRLSFRGHLVELPSLFLVRLSAVITSWEAPSRKITVEFAMETGLPAGWSGGSINPSSLQPNVRHHGEGAVVGPLGLLLATRE